MRLFKAFILRRLRSEPVRLGATLTGFALGIAVILAIRMANSSSVRGFETALETISGKASLEVVGSAEGLDETQLPRLGWLEEFGDVSPVIEGDAWYQLKDGGESVRILGVDILRDRSFREYRLLALQSGRQPDAREFLQLLVDPHSIILTSQFARRYGISAGGEIELLIGDRPQRFTVRALLDATGPARAYNGSFALMDIAAAQWAFASLGRLSRIEVRLDSPDLLDSAEQSVRVRLPSGLSVQRPARRGREAEKMLEAFHFNLAALSYISLIVGLFMIYNTVSVSVISRRGEVGTLRALGAGRGTILFLFLGEALLLAAAGCLAGLFLARYLARGAVALTATTVNVLYRGVVSAPPPPGITEWILAFAVGLPLGLLAAALPALEAARVTPTEAIRGADRLLTRRRLHRRHLMLPVLFLVAGWWLSNFEAVDGLPLYGFVSALFIVCGGAALTTPALYVLGKAGRRGVLARLLGVEGMLAHSNVSGSIPRLSVSVAALALSLSMMVAIAVMIGSFRETVIYWIGQTLRGDLYVSPASRTGLGGRAVLSPEVVRVVEESPEVASVDGFRRVELPYEGGTVTAAGGDFAGLLTRRNLVFKAPRQPWQALREAIGSDAVIASESFCIRHSRSVGELIELPVPAGQRRFRIAAVYFDYSSDRGIVVMDIGTFVRTFGDIPPSSLTVYLREGSDAGQARDAILQRLRGRFRVFINTNEGLRRVVLRIFDATFMVTYALEVIAIFVAILGVSSTLLTLILERRRELAMLRLIGAETGQITRMIVVEAVMLGAASQAIGLVVGLGLSLLLIYVINVQSFGWTIQFHLPAAFLAQMSVAIMLATALAGFYPAWRACRAAPAEEMAEE